MYICSFNCVFLGTHPATLPIMARHSTKNNNALASGLPNAICNVMCMYH